MFEGLRKALFKRRNAYRIMFRTEQGALKEAAKVVLADLRAFCRATSTPAVVSPVQGTIDPIATGIAIGRLEVWHRISQHLHVDDADLYKLVEQQDEDRDQT